VNRFQMRMMNQLTNICGSGCERTSRRITPSVEKWRLEDPHELEADETAKCEGGRHLCYTEHDCGLRCGPILCSPSVN
jgi:hypothetical protein